MEVVTKMYQNKPIRFRYELSTEIYLMVNGSDIADIIGIPINDFLKCDEIKNFVNILRDTNVPQEKILDFDQQDGVYFHHFLFCHYLMHNHYDLFFFMMDMLKEITKLCLINKN